MKARSSKFNLSGRVDGTNSQEGSTGANITRRLLAGMDNSRVEISSLASRRLSASL